MSATPTVAPSTHPLPPVVFTRSANASAKPPSPVPIRWCDASPSQLDAPGARLSSVSDTVPSAPNTVLARVRDLGADERDGAPWGDESASHSRTSTLNGAEAPASGAACSSAVIK